MKVIIIDDEKAMHLIMKRMLSKMVEVEIVGSFQETAAAFSYLITHEVDLIFVDISMPRENGFEFATRVRESGRELKLVFVTSHKEYALSAFEVYAYDYIVKPVESERLQQTVQRAISDKFAAIKIKKSEAVSFAVAFNCLGGIDIRSEQGVMLKWESSKSMELFCYLLMYKGRRVSREKLLEDIFHGAPPKSAEIYLNTTVYKLRKVLNLFGIKENLHSDSKHYALNLTQVIVDFLYFEEGCKRLAIINETNMQQAIELEQLYAGALFGDFAFPWAKSEIERISLMYTNLVQRLCDAQINGEHVSSDFQAVKNLQFNHRYMLP
ncbi:response regulator [Paenibacillus psychroresistens]|uniref:Response regulator n=1 Tax=Paenibacillus psychroresistens TaxID=1778678 RepID=A0A6B8RV33_9BACL|nr:response regulator [Paenibacillus psychroresistens]QGQ99722.1 response regulator [Paenibacillus psychroresistens]